MSYFFSKLDEDMNVVDRIELTEFDEVMKVYLREKTGCITFPPPTKEQIQQLNDWNSLPADRKQVVNTGFEGKWQNL